MNEAERLNNAIVRLDWLRSGEPEVQELARDWAAWWNGPRAHVPVGSSEWLSVLQFYGLRYRAAYARASKSGLVRSGDSVPMHIEAGFDPARVQAPSASNAPVYVPVAGVAPCPSVKCRSFPWGVALGAFGTLGLVLLLRKGVSS